MLPEVARSRLADFCDVFCETGVFDLDESRRILDRARDLGLRLKVHADELTPLGGAELAARLGAVSADHLLCITDAGIDALARSETVATLLPGTAFYLGLPYAPARRLIERGLTVALASDCNPGTCPTENLPLVGTMACTQMGMLPAEALERSDAQRRRRRRPRRSHRFAGRGQTGRPRLLRRARVTRSCSTTSESAMSDMSSNAAGWSTLLDPVPRRPTCCGAPTTPAWAKLSTCWAGEPLTLRPGQPVLLGFPQDEGVRRNHGRVGSGRSSWRHPPLSLSPDRGGWPNR